MKQRRLDTTLFRLELQICALLETLPGAAARYEEILSNAIAELKAAGLHDQAAELEDD